MIDADHALRCDKLINFTMSQHDTIQNIFKSCTKPKYTPVESITL